MDEESVVFLVDALGLVDFDGLGGTALLDPLAFVVATFLAEVLLAWDFPEATFLAVDFDCLLGTVFGFELFGFELFGFELFGAAN